MLGGVGFVVGTGLGVLERCSKLSVGAGLYSIQLLVLLVFPVFAGGVGLGVLVKTILLGFAPVPLFVVAFLLINLYVFQGEYSKQNNASKET